MTDTHAVRLFLREPAAPDKKRLLATLMKRTGNVVPLDETSATLEFLHLDHVSVRGAPAQFSVTPSGAGGVDDAVAQAWDWPGAKEAVAASAASLTVADRFASGLSRAARLRLMHGVVAAVMEHVPVTAIHWVPSDRLVDPKAYFDFATDLHRFVGASINVRLFGVNAPGSGECVMDTLGLGAFGLPDLQVHYKGLDGNRLAAWLTNLAAFTFEKGDLLANGSSVPGLEAGSDWTMRRECAIVAPKREVVDINPGR